MLLSFAYFGQKGSENLGYCKFHNNRLNKAANTTKLTTYTNMEECPWFNK